MRKSTRNNSFTLLSRRISHHSMSFTASCLSISKNSSIEPIDYRINYLKGDLLINKWLLRMNAKNLVICKTFISLFFFRVCEYDLLVDFICLYYRIISSVFLRCRERSATNNNFHCFRHNNNTNIRFIFKWNMFNLILYWCELFD